MESFSTDNPVIEVYDGETLLARMPLIQSGRRYRIGRDMTNDLVVRNEQVSRHHMTVLRRLDESVIIQDSRSRNGVTVNGKRIDMPHEMRASDTVAIGRLRIRITGLKAEEPAGKSSGAAVEPATGRTVEPPVRPAIRPALDPAEEVGSIRRGRWFILLIIGGMLLILSAILVVLAVAG